MPEAGSRESADVGAVVDDEIEAVRRAFGPDSIQKVPIALAAGIDPDTSARVRHLDRAEIQTDHRPFGEVVTPHLQRATVEDSELQYGGWPCAPVAKDFLEIGQIPWTRRLVRVVSSGNLG